MAEKTKFQRWLGSLTPEQREAFDASVEFGDQEMMSEVQNRLPPESRFGGLYGLLPYIGYDEVGDRAKINRYIMRDIAPPETTPRGFSAPNLEGYYTNSRASEKDMFTNKPSQFNRLLKFLNKEAGPTEGINTFYTLEDTPEADEFRRKVRPRTAEEKSRYADEYGNEPQGDSMVISHELSHRGMDHPAMRAFLADKYAERDAKLMDTPSYLDRINIDSAYPYLTRSTKQEITDKDYVNAERQHLTGVERFNPNFESRKQLYGDRADTLLRLQNQFKEWLTPERQEQYGVRLPVPAAEPVDPSMLDRLIDFIQGK